MCSDVLHTHDSQRQKCRCLSSLEDFCPPDTRPRPPLGNTWIRRWFACFCIVYFTCILLLIRCRPVSVPCYEGEIRCWPTMCIAAGVACDGYADCKDDFEETQQFCGTNNYPVQLLGSNFRGLIFPCTPFVPPPSPLPSVLWELRGIIGF